MTSTPDLDHLALYDRLRPAARGLRTAAASPLLVLGFATSYPVNRWLVRVGLKHAM